MKIIFVLISFLSCLKGNTQGNLMLSTANIVVSNTVTVYVNGNVQFNANTTLLNDGTVSLLGDWMNNSLSPAIDPATTGLVILNGTNQDIMGSDVTHFYDLELQTTGAIKAAQLDVVILNELNLNASVLETNQFLVHLQNPSIASLQWNGGFISGENLEGYFLRSTNSINSYSFPVGSSSLINNYRSVEITPTSVDSSVFGVRLASLSPSFETGTSASGSIAPFDLNLKEAILGTLNENYFHTIYRFFGNAECNTSIYFFENDTENDITTVGKWNTFTNQWEDDDFTISTLINPMPEYNLPNRVAMSKQAITYADDVYALSETRLIFPTGFSPNGDGYNDAFIIENLDLFPDNEIIIFNRWGEKIYSAKPYLNDWKGVNESNGIKLQGNDLQEDTYFYILRLDEASEPIKNYLELIRD